MTAGYLSEFNKRKFTIAAGIIGAIFFFAQFVVPMFLMMLAMPAMMLSGAFQFKIAHPERGAYWDNDIWYIETTQAFEMSGRTLITLNALAGGEDAASNVVAAIPFEKSWLLAGSDVLWIISTSGVACYADEDIQIVADGPGIGDISRPFFYNHVPAVIEENPSGFSLLLFENNRWEEKHFFTIEQLEGDRRGIADIQVLAADEQLHFFVKLGDTIFYRSGLPAGDGNDRNNWQPIVKSGFNWYTVLLDGQPAIFFSQSLQHLTEISGIRLKEDRWQSFFSYRQAIPANMGVFFIEGPDYFSMLLQGMPGSLKLLDFEGSKLHGQYRYGSGFPFPRSMMKIMMIPQLAMLLLPLVLALILSKLMLKHRISVHSAESVQMQYASLTRRALAQLVDVAVVFGPSSIFGLHFLFSSWDMEDFILSGPASMVGFFGIFACSFLWVAICFFAFSILEGKYGRTPGKWLTGIQVLGLDFHPCGIGRGLLRNLLKAVDGFFNFMVGIMLVALNENWQRVGDMAARTIVVRAGTRKQQMVPPKLPPI
jgi:uncharacterized RDD family membrane protein YckC